MHRAITAHLISVAKLPRNNALTDALHPSAQIQDFLGSVTELKSVISKRPGGRLTKRG